MEDLPPTLDDGELWLPSDIFPPDDNHHHQLHPSRPFASRASSMEDHSRQLNSLTFINRPPKPTSNPERLRMFGPIGRYALTPPSPTGCHALTVGPAVDHGLLNLSQTGPGFHLPGNPVLRPNSMVQPLHPRVPGQFMETRMARNSRPLFGQPNPSLSSTGFVFGSPMRNCHGPTSGTGVFIPRANSPNHKIPSTAKHLTGVKAQRMSAKAPRLGSGECNQHHQMSSTEVRLPKDWTY